MNAERFWRYVDRRGPDECWDWTGATRDGYGRVWADGRMATAHRVAANEYARLTPKSEPRVNGNGFTPEQQKAQDDAANDAIRIHENHAEPYPGNTEEA